MMMDLSQVMPWIGAALSIIALLTQLKSMLTAGEKRLDERVAKMEAKAVEFDRRIQSVESELKHTPDRGTMHRLEMALTEVSGKLSVLEERLRPIAATNERLNELLVEQARK